MYHIKSSFNFILILFSIIALTGCAKHELFIPEYNTLNPPPEEITIGQLQSDYRVNEIAANAKYKGERLLFNEVEVEQLGGQWVYIGLGEWIFEKTYFVSGSIKFRLRGEDYAIMQSIEEGYVLNIVGNCRGLVPGGYGEEPVVLVTDCWIESVVGNLGITWEPPFY